ncbi:hypothetical protein [Candidatus Avelusimicrobium fimicolum]|uniref:hypothetical protein n=1 Tax=Candidatus Avelusimicrobium fimicolum TaxID=3416216 RepID=UPI003D126051
MRRSLFLLATLAMSSALYAQQDANGYNREKVLDIFAQYNPVVLENAKNNADYNAVLENLAVSYQAPDTEEARFELISVARNFDNSIRLHMLSEQYEETLFLSAVNGVDSAATDKYFTRQVSDVLARVWAVTVNLREEQAKEYKRQLSQVKKDKTLSPADRSAKITALKAKIKAVKAEIKSLKKDSGEQISASAQAYIQQAQVRVQTRLAALSVSAEETSSLQTEQASNLQVKTNHKKPVAK